MDHWTTVPFGKYIGLTLPQIAFREQLRTVALPIKNHHEPKPVRVRFQLLLIAEIFRDEIIRHLRLGTVLSGESEIELEIIQPGDAWVDSLALELVRQVLVMSLEQSCVGSVVNGDLDRVTLHAEVALQAAQKISCQVL